MLHDGFLRAADRFGDRMALSHANGEAITFGDLAVLSQRVQGALARLDVSVGDRVAVALPKSIDAVAAILGVMRAGAAYVPLDSDAPAERTSVILSDASVKACLVAAGTEAHRAAVEAGINAPICAHVSLEPGGLAAWAESVVPTSEPSPIAVAPDGMAYLLYTSGSTGTPKGVATSHRAGAAFMDWFLDAFQPQAEDRFASVTPLFFSMSISDLFAPPHVGASTFLVDGELLRDPVRLAAAIDEHRITFWFSTPTALQTLEKYGRLDRHTCDSLRYVMFGGESYPPRHLRRLRRLWQGPRMLNVCGSTETSMRSIHEVPNDPEALNESLLPIGRSANNYLTRVVVDGRLVGLGEVGELQVSGPALMDGYWGRDDLNQRVFHADATGRRWFRTGDHVEEKADGSFVFRGRHDRMVKRHGYRIELAEIEHALARHGEVESVGVVAHRRGEGTTIVAFITTRRSLPPSLIDLKHFCVRILPAYMVPDRIRTVRELPRTPSGKVDYVSLEALATD